MGKKSRPATARGSALEPEVAEKVKEMKGEADKLFLGKEFTKAIEAYDKAIKVVPSGAAEAADLHTNKAACFYQLKKFKDAAKECSTALEIQPSSFKGLYFRAKALEQQGLYKMALADVQAINKSDGATDETRDAEKRLKDIMAGRRSGPVNGDSAPARPAGRAGGRLPLFVAKCSLGSEVRNVHMPHSQSYAELLTAVRAKFPEAGPFLLKYVDRQGDLVTITQRADLQLAMQEALAAYEKQVAGSHGPKLLAAQAPPPIRIQLVPVAGEADIPRPPEEEEAERLQLEYARALQAKAAAGRRQQEADAAAAAAAAATAGNANGAGNEVYEIDEWLVDFANLFREITGVDSDRHVELHNLGWDKTQRAMDAALMSDKALPLFARGAERFKEVTCTGLLNWGNVHVCIAHKFLDEAATNGAPLAGVADRVSAEFAEAERRYKEAMAYKPDFYDGACALGQLEFERAKLAAGLLVKPVRSAQTDDAEAAADTARQLSEALQAALASVTAASVAVAQGHIDKSDAYFKQALEFADKEKKRSEEEAKEDAAAGAADGKDGGAAASATAEGSLRSSALIMHGNILYEWSQIVGAVSVAAGWRPLLDSAVAMFRSAGCAEADIRNALRNHSKKDEIDLGPEPEPPAKPAPAAAATAKATPAAAAAPAADKKAAEPAPTAKGLPSLAVKSKK